MGRPQKFRKVVPILARVGKGLWPDLRKQRTLATGATAALFAEVAMRLLEPWPLKFIFDYVIVPAKGGKRHDIPFVESIDPASLLTISVLAVVAIVGMRSLASYVKIVAFALAGNRVLTEVRSRLYRHLQALSLSFHHKAKHGDLVVRVVGDIGMLKEVTVTAMLPLLANMLILVGMLLMMFLVNWRLALISLIVVPLFWLSTTRLSRRIGHAAREQRKRESAIAAMTAESMGAIQTVQALSLENKFTRIFASQNKKSLKEGVKVKRLSAKLERTADVLIAIATALVTWYGAKLVLREMITPGDLLVFLAYLKNAFKPIRNFAKYTGRLAKAAAAGERVMDVLEMEPTVRDLPDAKPAPVFDGAVRFDHVGFAYDVNSPPVLDDMDFEIQPCQHVAIIGVSGIGKSTLVSLILRLYDPQQGRVMIDGHNVREYTLASLRSQISVVLQETLLFGGTISENIGCARPGATLDEIQAAAAVANADTFIQAMPRGYDTVVGERGVTLSGGQRQRIAIARAAIRQAPLLILDEPTTGLDEENARAVCEALFRLAQGRTTFIISHDLELSSLADLILCVEDGRIAEYGTHKQLIQNNGAYADLHRLQNALTVTA